MYTLCPSSIEVASNILQSLPQPSCPPPSAIKIPTPNRAQWAANTRPSNLKLQISQRRVCPSNDFRRLCLRICFWEPPELTQSSISAPFGDTETQCRRAKCMAKAQVTDGFSRALKARRSDRWICTYPDTQIRGRQ